MKGFNRSLIVHQNAFYRLYGIIEYLMREEPELVYLSNGDFLGKFVNRRIEYGDLFSMDKSRSGILAFEQMFDFYFCPEKENECDEIVHRCLCAVQCDESDEESVGSFEFVAYGARCYS